MPGPHGVKGSSSQGQGRGGQLRVAWALTECAAVAFGGWAAWMQMIFCGTDGWEQHLEQREFYAVTRKSRIQARNRKRSPMIREAGV